MSELKSRVGEHKPDPGSLKLSIKFTYIPCVAIRSFPKSMEPRKKTKNQTTKENTFKDSSVFWSQISIIRAILIVKTHMSIGNRKCSFRNNFPLQNSLAVVLNANIINIDDKIIQ